MSARFSRSDILESAAEHFGLDVAKFYSEDQPRGADGKWGGEQFRDVGDKERGKLADKDEALPDGSFPIKTKADLMNARHAVGRAKDPEKAKALIRKRAKELGVDLPEDFFAEGGQTFAGGERGAARLTFASSPSAQAETPIITVDGVEYVKGNPLHIFPFGVWTAVDGRHVEFTEQDATALIGDLKTRNSHVALTYDHEQDKARGSMAAGWMDPRSFELRADGLWANDVYFTKPAYFGDNDKGGIKGGEWRYISGDALGIGSANAGDAFHPRRLLAASLVPKPGFVRGLQGITLGVDESAALTAWLKEPEMAKLTRAELCQQMGLDPKASKEEFASALEKWAKEEADEPEHKGSLKAGAEDGEEVMGAKEGKPFAAKHTKANCPDPENCDQDGHDEPDADDEEEEQMSAKVADDLNKKFAAMGTEVADKAIAEAKRAAETAVTTQVEARFAAEAKTREIDTLITAALGDGRLSGDAQATIHREAFASNFDLGKKLLESLPKPAVRPEDALVQRHAFITGGVQGGGSGSRWSKEAMTLPNGKPNYDAQSEFLTEIMRFGSAKSMDIKTATEKVLKGENVEFENLLREANGRTAEQFTKAEFGAFRHTARATEYDIERARYVRNRILDGNVPNLAPGVLAEAQKFASIGDFQPAARTTIPMGLGYPQADFVGDEALPVFVGGADEAYAWPEYSFEKFAALAESAGILGQPVWSSLNITWHRGTLEKFPVGTKVDRRLRAASVTLPEGIDTTVLTNLKSQVGTSREVAQHTFLATNGNYFDSSFYPTISPQWSAADSPASYAGLPMNDITKGLAHVRVNVRKAPDLLILSYNAALSMRKNQQVIDTVRYTGTMERPGTMVSNATLAALFAGMFNLTIVVAEAGDASLPSGLPVADVWGNDAWLVCTGRGEVIAPRFGITAVAAGSPRVRAFPEELIGADGTDSVVVTDSWSIASVNNKAAYWLKSASAAL